jgi:hypothetical protein
MTARAVALALALAAALPGCGKAKRYDRSTPEKTVASFFQALRDGRIPDDLEQFFADEHEVAVWRLRCESRGCKGGNLGTVTVEERYDYRAILRVRYEVLDHRGVIVMRGDDAPVTLTREGKNWQIHQFGERRVIERSTADAGAGDGG